ncbi:MAG: glycoside hydrolase family 25 protein [Alphaproteobacteria bacterium]
MRFSILHRAFLFLLLPTCGFASTSVVNLSHYDMMRPDFATMKRQGIVGVIHEATYPPFTRDAKYLDRQLGALEAGLLWGAYHYGNGSDPVRQADHFLSVVSNAWAHASPATRPSAGVLLVLDFEKNGHYPGGTMRPDQAVAFVERIRQRTGVYPGIYSGEYHLNQVLNSSRVTNAQRRTLTNCWLWVANYSKQPRATAPWSYWALWQYCGDGKCRLPRSVYPTSIANIRKAELNIFRGSRGDLQDFWQQRSWQPSGGKSRESEPKLAAD